MVLNALAMKNVSRDFSTHGGFDGAVAPVPSADEAGKVTPQELPAAARILLGR